VELPLDGRDHRADARRKLPRVGWQLDQLIARVQERIADKLSVECVTS